MTGLEGGQSPIQQAKQDRGDVKRSDNVSASLINSWSTNFAQSWSTSYNGLLFGTFLAGVLHMFAVHAQPDLPTALCASAPNLRSTALLACAPPVISS